MENGFNWQEILEKHKFQALAGLSGVLLLTTGLLILLWSTRSQDEIEILSSETTKETQDMIQADIEGAVVNPGLYKLAFGSRVDDLLIAAGGLSATADREWIDKTLNRAQKLTDGVKIYVPSKTESTKSTTSIKGIKSDGVQSLVNINTATQAELEALSGIGPVTARKIIESRPYQDVGDLLTRKILNSNLYQKLKTQLSVY